MSIRFCKYESLYEPEEDRNVLAEKSVTSGLFIRIISNMFSSENEDDLLHRKSNAPLEHRLEFFIPEHIATFIHEHSGQIDIPAAQHFETVAMFSQFRISP